MGARGALALLARFDPFAQRGFACGDEVVDVIADTHDIAVQIDHVVDRRRNHRPTGRQVLERLRGADETGRMVEREGQQTDVPAGE